MIDENKQSELYKEYHVLNEDDGTRLDKWIKKNVPEMPFDLMQKMVRKGAVKVDDKKRKTDYKLVENQLIKISTFEDRGSELRDKKRNKVSVSENDIENFISKQIIYRDDNLIGINKKYGLSTQGGTKIKLSIDDILPYIENITQRPKLVHRIDKDTSGVILVSLNKESAKEATLAFKKREFIKTYWAVIVGVPSRKEGRINIPLIERSSSAGIDKMETTYHSDKNPSFKRAVTYYKVIETAGKKMCWIALRPETGRKHQLRVHLSAIGHPILGDGKYGGKEAFIDGMSNKMHLHSKTIEHENFMGKRIDLTAPLQGHMVETWKMLEFSKNYNYDPFSNIDSFKSISEKIEEIGEL